MHAVHRLTKSGKRLLASKRNPANCLTSAAVTLSNSDASQRVALHVTSALLSGDNSPLGDGHDGLICVRQKRTLAMGTMASLYLSIMVMNTLPLIGSRCPAASAALAYAALKLSSMPITSPVDRISGPSSVSAPAAGWSQCQRLPREGKGIEGQNDWVLTPGWEHLRQSVHKIGRCSLQLSGLCLVGHGAVHEPWAGIKLNVQPV